MAARYVNVDAPEKLAAAKAVFVLAGSLISFLMPIGLAFQAIAMLSLGVLLLTGPPRRRSAGAFGALAGILILAAVAGTPAAMAAHVLLGGIVLITLWYLILAALLWRGGLPD